MGECIALLWLMIFYRCFCLNELLLVLREICVQRTLVNSILLIMCFCFVLHCSSFWCLFCKCFTFFLPCMVYKIKSPLTVFNYHTILIENVCKLSCKSMLPTMFIKMCVKLKHIYLSPYVEKEDRGSEKRIYPNPLCLEFFWYSPYSGKEAGSAMHVLHQAIKIRVT